MVTYSQENLTAALLAEFTECGENCTRAYHPPQERDSEDHDAVHAQRVIGAILGIELREQIYDAYRETRNSRFGFSESALANVALKVVQENT